MTPLRPHNALLLSAAYAGAAAFSQARAHPQLVAEIPRIRAIGNHCHDAAADLEHGKTWSLESPTGRHATRMMEAIHQSVRHVDPQTSVYVFAEQR